MQHIENFNFKNKTALVRVDYNVPMDAEYKITDSVKIDATFPTVDKILSDGGRVVLMSHLGRPKANYDARLSLKPICEYLEKSFNKSVKFATYTDTPSDISGEIVLLENLRFHEGEDKADLTFAKSLAKWGDVFVNDAFATAHREHASTAIVPNLFRDKMGGFLMQKEIENADRILKNPTKPFALIVGGAKISDKIKPIKNLLPLIDTLILGGGAANTFLHAMDVHMGGSLLQENMIDDVFYILDYAKAKGVKIVLPVDFVVVKTENDVVSWPEVVETDDIEEGYSALDIGPRSREKFATEIEKAKTILWSGPMGVAENEIFRMGTQAVANAVKVAVKSGAFSLVGGGDTVASLSEEKFDDLGSISTGGSALLEYIADQKLPAIVALNK